MYIINCDGMDPPRYHSGDYNPQDGRIALTELLRVIQIYSMVDYHCHPQGEDGYGLEYTSDELSNYDCENHDADSNGDWKIDMSEIIALVQLYNAFSYEFDSDTNKFEPICKGDKDPCQDNNYNNITDYNGNGETDISDLEEGGFL